jgi:uncharacterized protein YecT (DUF1311 family)
MKIELKKGRSLFWSIAFLGIFGTTSVFAQSRHSVVAEQINCYQLLSRSQGDFRNCIHLRYKAADKRLNDVYKQLIAKLNGEEKALLSESQLEWIKQRDKNCEFEVYQYRGGTGYRAFLDHCLERMTKQRTAELNEFLQRRYRKNGNR